MKSKNKLITVSFGLCFLLSLFSIVSCKKLVEINAPVTSVNSDNVYTRDASAAAVLTGIYTNMSKNSDFTGSRSISVYLGLSVDEFTLANVVSTTDARYYYYTNALFAPPTGGAGSNFWAPLFRYIFVCNAAIEGLNGSTSLTPALKQQLLGEATFMRAFFYFYLVNMFGDLPLITNTDYKVNLLMARTPRDKVYEQIINDLKDAQSMLNENYVDASAITSTSERTRPNKWVATALLARAYLYTGDWNNAIAQSNLIINNSSMFNLAVLNNVFLKNSSESIWQLQPINSQRNTEDAWTFIIPSSGPDASNRPVYLSPQLLNSFELLDERKKNWVNSVTVGTTTYYYPYKYKSAKANASLTEYLMVFRLAEQYLILAEAEAQQDNIAAAQAALNVIRNRAGLLNTTANNKTSLLASILHERQVELFTELGHRWLDLKRTNNVDAMMTLVCPQKKNSQWRSYQQLYPLPVADINAGLNLEQNSGY
jgi:hypothetical protein